MILNVLHTLLTVGCPLTVYKKPAFGVKIWAAIKQTQLTEGA
jgi:hypothetical protein